MVDCRSLIEFCRAFEQHRSNNRSTTSNSSSSNRSNKKNNNNNNSNSLKSSPPSFSLCNLSVFAAIDVIFLFCVLASIGVLTFPYFTFIFHEATHLLPLACLLIGDIVCNAPVAYALGCLFTFFLFLVIWEFISIKARKCGNPYCKGLRKAVEFDIQLESEECVKCLPPTPEDVYGLLQPLDIGQDHKELEAELKRMAPLNGRTVLIFRTPCGCPAGRMEVWGPKKIRRLKK